MKKETERRRGDTERVGVREGERERGREREREREERSQHLNGVTGCERGERETKKEREKPREREKGDIERNRERGGGRWRKIE